MLCIRNLLKPLYAASFLALATATFARAQEAPAPAAIADVQQNLGPGQDAAQGGDPGGLEFLFNPIDQVSFWLSIAFLVFGLAVLGLQLFLLGNLKSLRADDIMKNSSMTVVVIASVVLLIAGYNSAQLGPVFGLFGTMIGYVLGRASSPTPPPQKDPDEASH